MIAEFASGPIDSDSGQEIWSDDKLDQAHIGQGIRFWNGSEAGNSGATFNSGNSKWEFPSSNDSEAWWQGYWVRVKQDPGTGTFSDWINLTNASGNIYVNAQSAYNSIGHDLSNYEPTNTWVDHVSGFRYIVEIYADNDRPT